MKIVRNFIFMMIFLAWLIPTQGFSLLKRPLNTREIQVLTKNVEKDPNNIKSRLFLASHYDKLKDWPRVIQFLGPVSEKLPHGALYKLAHSFMQVGEYNNAHSILNIPLSGNHPQTKFYLLSAQINSKILEHRKDNQEATNRLFEALKTAQKADPTNVEIYNQWLHYLEKHMEHYAFEALRVMEDMKKNEITFLPEHTSLSCKYHHLAKLTKETKEACQEAIKQDPQNPSNHIYLGQVHVNTGEEKRGKRILASVGRKFSQSHKALLATAQSHYENKDLAKSFQYYRKASQHPEAGAETYLGLAQTAFQLKKYKIALDGFSKHCRLKKYLHHEFRKASGLLVNHPKWKRLYREKMINCKPKNQPKPS